MEKEPFNYVIQIIGPSGAKNSRLYDTDKFGSGGVRVYRTIEGNLPAPGHPIDHLINVGYFELKESSNKTPQEFMREIRSGIEKISSQDK